MCTLARPAPSPPGPRQLADSTARRPRRKQPPGPHVGAHHLHRPLQRPLAEPGLALQRPQRGGPRQLVVKRQQRGSAAAAANAAAPAGGRAGGGAQQADRLADKLDRGGERGAHAGRQRRHVDLRGGGNGGAFSDRFERFSCAPGSSHRRWSQQPMPRPHGSCIRRQTRSARPGAPIRRPAHPKRGVPLVVGLVLPAPGGAVRPRVGEAVGALHEELAALVDEQAVDHPGWGGGRAPRERDEDAREGGGGEAAVALVALPQTRQQPSRWRAPRGDRRDSNGSQGGQGRPLWSTPPSHHQKQYAHARTHARTPT